MQIGLVGRVGRCWMFYGRVSIRGWGFWSKGKRGEKSDEGDDRTKPWRTDEMATDPHYRLVYFASKGPHVALRLAIALSARSRRPSLGPRQ